MKKVILLTLAGAISFGSFAQKTFNKNTKVTKVNGNFLTAAATGANYRTTGNGDTVKGRINFAGSQLDSLTIFPVDAATPLDSGFVFGPNAFGDKGWAERFDITGADSSVKVIGTYAIFSGSYNAASTNTVNIKVWAQGPKSTFGGNILQTGLPTTTLASQTVSVKNLGIDAAGAGNDSVKLFMFTTPTTNIADSFFVGYEPNYSFANANGDKISLMSTRYGYRYDQNYYFIQGGDTIVNVRNASEFSDGTWHDNTFDNFQIPCNLAVFPVFVISIGVPTSVTAITKNDLTFYGNYPNPAVNNTNIKFALKNSADVTVSIYDMNGRVINTINQSKLGAGEHTIPVETASLAAGNYIYLIRTSNGDGMASQLSVVK